ncbi:hypothetical protein O3P69_003715 [Scylla paramamosain]|uniref:BHLH domain-containing protein n=1 Tax=Scylla paramamosain TaxID=85552 RepID=A0AAW0UGC6_SCYPA
MDSDVNESPATREAWQDTTGGSWDPTGRAPGTRAGRKYTYAIVACIRKPLMERKRRERINTSLNDLASLLTEARMVRPDAGGRPAKLEKADILELTVKHILRLKRRPTAPSDASKESSTDDSSGPEAVAAPPVWHDHFDEDSQDSLPPEGEDKGTQAPSQDSPDSSSDSQPLQDLTSTPEPPQDAPGEPHVCRKAPTQSGLAINDDSYQRGFVRCMNALSTVLPRVQDASLRQRLWQHLQEFLSCKEGTLVPTPPPLPSTPQHQQDMGATVSPKTEAQEENPAARLTLVPTKLPGGGLALLVQGPLHPEAASLLMPAAATVKSEDKASSCSLPRPPAEPAGSSSTPKPVVSLTPTEHLTTAKHVSATVTLASVERVPATMTHSSTVHVPPTMITTSAERVPATVTLISAERMPATVNLTSAACVPATLTATSTARVPGTVTPTITVAPPTTVSLCEPETVSTTEPPSITVPQSTTVSTPTMVLPSTTLFPSSTVFPSTTMLPFTSVPSCTTVPPSSTVSTVTPLCASHTTTNTVVPVNTIVPVTNGVNVTLGVPPPTTVPVPTAVSLTPTSSPASTVFLTTVSNTTTAPHITTTKTTVPHIITTTATVPDITTTTTTTTTVPLSTTTTTTTTTTVSHIITATTVPLSTTTTSTTTTTTTTTTKDPRHIPCSPCIRPGLKGEPLLLSTPKSFMGPRPPPTPPPTPNFTGTPALNTYASPHTTATPLHVTPTTSRRVVSPRCEGGRGLASLGPLLSPPLTPVNRDTPPITSQQFLAPPPPPPPQHTTLTSLASPQPLHHHTAHTPPPPPPPPHLLYHRHHYSTHAPPPPPPLLPSPITTTTTITHSPPSPPYNLHHHSYRHHYSNTSTTIHLYTPPSHTAAAHLYTLPPTPPTPPLPPSLITPPFPPPLPFFLHRQGRNGGKCLEVGEESGGVDNNVEAMEEEVEVDVGEMEEDMPYDLSLRRMWRPW